MRKRNLILLVAVFLCLSLMGFAYAQFSSQVVIKGSATASGSFDVVFDTLDDQSVNYTAYSNDGVIATVELLDEDTVSLFAENFKEEGDTVVVTLYVKNKGTVDACIGADDVRFDLSADTSRHFIPTTGIYPESQALSPGEVGTVIVTLECINFEPLETYDDITITLGYHQQTVESAPTVTHVHN